MESCTDGNGSTGRCPIKKVLGFLSGTWTAEIFYHLHNQSLRFGELQRSVGASAKVLTERLRKLEDAGIIHREVRPTKPPQVHYSLTPFGGEFWPVLKAMEKVGLQLLQQSSASEAERSESSSPAAR